MTNYLFYDLETTGLNPAFDQILRFAAIKTDESLQATERIEISVKLRPDIIPSPHALVTNRLSLNDLQAGCCEYEAVQRIHALFNTPHTISIGYNTLGFDDEFLRFCYFRNLLPPYTHQYRNGCRRMDMLPIATLYYLYKPDVLCWPQEDGRPSLKLENLKEANHLAEGAAHDAMVDVEATVELARRLQREKQMWAYIDGYFDKATDQARCHKLPIAFTSASSDHRLGLMISNQFGPERQFQSPVLSIGQSIPYGNQSLWLRMDLAELQNYSGENPDETTWVIRKRMGEPNILLPPHTRYMEKLSPETKILLEQNQQWLRSHSRRFQEIIQYHQHFRYPEIPNVDADAALYTEGFLSSHDEALCERFHGLALPDKVQLISKFSSLVTRQLAVRLLFRNAHTDLPPNYVHDMQRYMEKVHAAPSHIALIDYRGQSRRTPQTALKQIESMQTEGGLDPQQQHILTQLKTYIQGYPPKSLV
jgi:exodeoxyribonuclease-1